MALAINGADPKEVEWARDKMEYALLQREREESSKVMDSHRETPADSFGVIRDLEQRLTALRTANEQLIASCELLRANYEALKVERDTLRQQRDALDRTLDRIAEVLTGHKGEQ